MNADRKIGRTGWERKVVALGRVGIDVKMSIVWDLGRYLGYR